MCGFTICDYCAGDGAVRTATGEKHDCTVCDGTGMVPKSQRVVDHRNNPLSDILSEALQHALVKS